MKTMSGAVTFFELGVEDAKKGRAFYEGLFGWEFETGPSGNGWVISTPGLPGGMHPGDKGATPYLFFAVEDMDAALERVDRAGRRDRAVRRRRRHRLREALRALQVLQGRPGLALRPAPAAGLMARVVRHESERDRWEMVHAAPDPRLDGYVLDYCAYDERTGSFTRRRELPSERVVIIVNLGEPIRVMHRRVVVRPAGEGFFAGHARHVRGDRDGRRAARRADRPLARSARTCCCASRCTS